MADNSNALTIDTGSATIQNAGNIDCTAAGGLTIKSALANTGQLIVSAGTLTALGAVSGTGSVRIVGGTADFAKAFTENVAFTSTKGTLELANSEAYTGTVSGFSKTIGTSLDLLDIKFVSGVTKATYSGNATSGILTVTDGTHAAKIKLIGNYASSAFVVADDKHGGTLVHDPAKPATASSGPPKRSFVQATHTLFAQALSAMALDPPGPMPAAMRHDPPLMLAAPRFGG